MTTVIENPENLHTQNITAMRADPWISSSALQKAIRRGEADIAASAALSLLAARGSAIFRRFLVIAFEDVGAADPDAVIQTVLACSNPAWRQQEGGNARVVVGLARLLANANKDRSSDYLICLSKDHESLADARERVVGCSLDARIAMAVDTTLPLTVRATAAWYASGVEWGDERRVGLGDLPGLLSAFRDGGIPEPLLDATRIAAARTHEPITIMAPLIWQAIVADANARVARGQVPPSPSVDGVPLYALDMHTRTGRRAIELLIKENVDVRGCLEQHVRARSPVKAAYVAAFYTDGAPLNPRLMWSEADALERLGIENDFLVVGVALEGVMPLLDAFRANLDHLNAIRAQLLAAGPSPAPIGPLP